MKEMQMRTLGNSSLSISAVGLGCMGITPASGTPMSKKEGAQVVRQAYEMGYTLNDGKGKERHPRTNILVLDVVQETVYHSHSRQPQTGAFARKSWGGRTFFNRP